LKDLKQGGSGIVTRGRRPLLSENGVAKLEQRLTDRVLDLNAPKADGDIQKMLLEAVAEEALNNYGVRSNVDPKTLKNYLNKMDAKVVEKGREELQSLESIQRH